MTTMRPKPNIAFCVASTDEFEQTRAPRKPKREGGFRGGKGEGGFKNGGFKKDGFKKREGGFKKKGGFSGGRKRD